MILNKEILKDLGYEEGMDEEKFWDNLLTNFSNSPYKKHLGTGADRIAFELNDRVVLKIQVHTFYYGFEDGENYVDEFDLDDLDYYGDEEYHNQIANDLDFWLRLDEDEMPQYAELYAVSPDKKYELCELCDAYDVFMDEHIDNRTLVNEIKEKVKRLSETGKDLYSRNFGIRNQKDLVIIDYGMEG